MLSLLCALAVGAASPSQTRPPPLEVPALPSAPKLDGKPAGFAKALVVPANLSSADGGTSASIDLRLGTFKDTLFVGVDVKDDQPLPADTLKLELHFPAGGAGTEALTFEAGPLGLRVIPVDAPAYLRKLVRAEKSPGPGLRFVELAIPARALPRFPAQGPLVFELCATYSDVDAPASPATELSSCEMGSMKGPALKLPDSFRRPVLALKPPPRVAFFEGRDGAWVGYESQRFPLWVSADKDLTAASLTGYVAENPVDPEKVGLAISQKLSLPDGRLLVPVLSGKDPFATPGRCDNEAELRLGLYLIKGKTAARALEWPAATCSLGRALSVVVDDEGELTIGYSTGTALTFAWTGDHFERTEIGRR